VPYEVCSVVSVCVCVFVCYVCCVCTPGRVAVRMLRMYVCAVELDVRMCVCVVHIVDFDVEQYVRV